ncbi:hypothetical protein COU58_03085, partial [Candidatus Pacearchaeota archaeon CG10_big_fil_rev_8_21_14_0_10_32_42]
DGCYKKNLECNEDSGKSKSFFAGIKSFVNKNLFYLLAFLLGVLIIIVAYFLYKKIRKRKVSFQSGIFLDKRYGKI